MIEALRDEPDLDLMTTRLASEVALASVTEKAFLLQRMLLSGGKEPNVSANNVAQQALTKESSVLDKEIDNLRAELDLRQ